MFLPLLISLPFQRPTSTPSAKLAASRIISTSASTTSMRLLNENSTSIHQPSASRDSHDLRPSGAAATGAPALPAAASATAGGLPSTYCVLDTSLPSGL